MYVLLFTSHLDKLNRLKRITWIWQFNVYDMIKVQCLFCVHQELHIYYWSETCICIHHELHVLYIININKQDITYLKDDLTCEKTVYSINNETSNLFQSSVITFQPKHWIPDDTFGISVLLQFWDVKFCSNSFTHACHFYFESVFKCLLLCHA